MCVAPPRARRVAHRARPAQEEEKIKRSKKADFTFDSPE
jgi:hypothetical protein